MPKRRNSRRGHEDRRRRPSARRLVEAVGILAASALAIAAGGSSKAPLARTASGSPAVSPGADLGTSFPIKVVWGDNGEATLKWAPVRGAKGYAFFQNEKFLTKTANRARSHLTVIAPPNGRDLYLVKAIGRAAYGQIFLGLTETGCFSSPGACGFPDPAYRNVGVPAGTQLRPSTSLTVRRPGTVVDGLDITGTLNIEADDVTVENTRITSDGNQDWLVYDSGEGDVLKNVEFYAPPGAQVAEGIHEIGGSVTIDRLYSHGPDNAVHGDGLIENSYLLSALSVPDNHVEDIYCDTTGGLVVSHDTIFNPIPQTAAIFCDTDGGSGGSCENHLTVTGSLIAGGGYILYPCGNASSPGSAVLTVEDNRFARCTTAPVLFNVYSSNGQTCSGGYSGESGPGLPSCAVSYPAYSSCSESPGQVPDDNGYYPHGGYFGTDAYAFCGTSNMTWTDNVWDDDGATVAC